MQITRARQGPLRRVRIIHQIPIGIMLHYKLARIKPIVEDLAPHDMPPYAPAVLVALVPQPVVAQHLRVVVERLKAAVVHVRGARALEEEEAVVVDLLGALVEAEEDGHVFARRGVDQLGRQQVEVGREELVFFLVVGYAEPEVSELVDRGGALLEALRLVDVAGWLAGLMRI